MQQRKPDPFFEQLREDVQEGIDAADQGDVTPAEEVWQELNATIEEIERKAPPLP